MSRFAKLWAAIAIAVLFGFTPPVFASKVNAGGLHEGMTVDRFIVRFNRDTPERDKAAARRQFFLANGRAFGVGIAQLRRLAVGADLIRTSRRLDRSAARQFMQRLGNDPHVDYVEPDLLLKPTSTPNDPYYSSQWHYFEPTAGIDLPGAWDSSTGSGVVVAVIDTGITAHSDLSANIIAGYDFVADPLISMDGDGWDADPTDPGDWSDGTLCPMSNSDWHGTHVAGTIAAVGNNAIGVVGVAYNAKVEPLRALGRCGGYTSDISDAIVWASGGTVSGIPANANRAEVINLSLSGAAPCDNTEQSAIDAAVAAGTTVVVAAGNANDDVANYTPASCNHVIAVAAVGRTGARASYSNYGDHVDVAAPGGDSSSSSNWVLSTENSGTTTPGGEIYRLLAGTSMAAPHVAGTIALMQSVQAHSPAGVESILKSTAHPLPVPCPEGCGAGIIDAKLAVSYAANPDLFVTDAVVTEGDSGTQLATFTVILSQPLSTAVSYRIATSDGTAKAGSDYIARGPMTQSIPAGQTSQTFTVTINGDATIEPNETFTVNLSNALGAIIDNPQGVGTIYNNDGPLLWIDDASVVEGNSGTKQEIFTAHLTKASASPVTFDFNTIDYTATQGSDYVGSHLTSQSIPAGQTSKTFGVTINGDTAIEPDEFLSATLSNAVGASIPVSQFGIGVDGQGVGTIVNDDGPLLSVADVSITEGNSGTKLMTFTVKLSQPAATAVTYDITTFDNSAVAGSDYMASSLTGQSIPAGQTSKTFTVTINGDSTVEHNESFWIYLSNPTGASIPDGWAIGTIVNDDGPTLSINNANVSEGNSGTKTLTFTVSLSVAASSAVTYSIATANNTATAGSDYVASSLSGQSIPAGMTSKTFSVTINGDTAIEPNETFFVNLFNVAGATVADATGVGTISNDDLPSLAINNASVSEGNSGTKTLTFTVSLSAAASSTVTYSIATANNTATAGSDYVASALTGQNIAAGLTSKTFNVTIDGDTTIEPNETFFANVFNVVGATVADPTGVGTISNDD